MLLLSCQYLVPFFFRFFSFYLGIVRSRHLTFSNSPGVEATVLRTPVRADTSSDGQELISRRLNVLHLSSKRKVGVKRDEDFHAAGKTWWI